MRPEVSITMPVLNGERYIGEAIDRILAQTYPNYQLVVVDDGSSDGTAAIVKSYADKLELVYVRHEKPLGIAPSMNDGVRHSTGDLIAFLDHDDAWLPNFLETQVSYLEQHPDTGMVHSDFQTTDTDGNILESSVALCRGRKRPTGNIFRELFLDSFIVGNSVLIRRECFTRLGLFDESLKWGDYHMWLRIARHYKVAYVDQVLTSYRQHFSQSTRSVAVSRPDEESVAMKAIDKLLAQYPELREELGGKLINHRRASLYFDLAYAWYVKGEFGHARVCAQRALALWPTNPTFLLFWAGTLLRPAQMETARLLWRRFRNAQNPEKAAADRVQRMGSIS